MSDYSNRTDYIEQMIEGLLDDLLAGRLTEREVLQAVLSEMGRGGRTLMVDETSYHLTDPLTDKRYTVDRVFSGQSDFDVQQRLYNKILITQNGGDFCKPSDMEKYHYGLIWLPQSGDAEKLVDEVESVLMSGVFRPNLHRVIRIPTLSSGRSGV